MLQGTLGSHVLQEAQRSDRFVDLFSGTGSVAKYVATRTTTSVLAVDKQAYGALLAGSVLERTSPLDGRNLTQQWMARAEHYLSRNDALRRSAVRHSNAKDDEAVFSARRFIEDSDFDHFVWKHYGAHYFSPSQALMLAALLETLPHRRPYSTVARAALIMAASASAASPGHTAQPFQPGLRLLPHLRMSWSVDVATKATEAVSTISSQYAGTKGRALTSEATAFVRRYGRRGDVLFCDPPYSEAQYSRFYHVLEGLARGGWNEVAGAGRAPALNERFRSDFSSRSESKAALKNLLEAASEKESTLVLTYPEGERSNGLTIDQIESAASGLFSIEEMRIPTSHSTLGGSVENSILRGGRQEVFERVITLRPL